ncbi:hypothetical protein ACFC66_11010, partial [Streptomyces bacillaris]
GASEGGEQQGGASEGNQGGASEGGEQQGGASEGNQGGASEGGEQQGGASEGNQGGASEGNQGGASEGNQGGTSDGSDQGGATEGGNGTNGGNTGTTGNNDGTTGTNGTNGTNGGTTTGGGDACTVDSGVVECADNTDTDSIGNQPVEQSKGKEELAETGAAETTFLVIGAATMIAGGIGFRILPRLVGGGRTVA